MVVKHLPPPKIGQTFGHELLTNKKQPILKEVSILNKSEFKSEYWMIFKYICNILIYKYKILYLSILISKFTFY